MPLTPAQRTTLGFLGALALAAVALAWNPRGILSPGLRDSLLGAAASAALITLVLERLLPAPPSAEPGTARIVEATLAADVRALWSLLRGPLARDDVLRASPPEVRLARYLSDLEEPATWATAPATHASAVRGIIREMGEDAAELGRAQTTTPGIGPRLEALRDACRRLDETWATTPRGNLAGVYRETIGPELRAILGVDEARR